jgi:hypothetical protein
VLTEVSVAVAGSSAGEESPPSQSGKSEHALVAAAIMRTAENRINTRNAGLNMQATPFGRETAPAQGRSYTARGTGGANPADSLRQL